MKYNLHAKLKSMALIIQHNLMGKIGERLRRKCLFVGTRSRSSVINCGRKSNVNRIIWGKINESIQVSNGLSSYVLQ